MSERWDSYMYLPKETEEQKPGAEKTRIMYLSLWIAAFSSNKSRQVIKQVWHLIVITLQVCCPVQVFIMVKKQKKTK